MNKVIEIIEQATDSNEAQTMVSALGGQDGVWGARVIGDGRSRTFTVQAFMDLPEGVSNDALPDGWNIRIAPPAVMASRPAR